ncbi:IucA/IucC family protein [Nitrosovibrio sp. Nv4]|uniref:IucA/IucC family protein n=1 Tax=Nitrosovibrio sp. Nv4 TaxID=1945880 RepID=UPI000BC3AE94|nr:IucA/IucC family protein [Nitrosovibrio sp. Nv4]SOD41485.1 Siderophore synthetase component [Nitrosovibrio sp. Nv4]
MHPLDYKNLINSLAYREASRRVLRQLLEALLFEGAVPHCTWDEETLTLPGLRADDIPVSYQCQARQTMSFGRVRITAPLLRIDNGAAHEASDPALFLSEIAPWLVSDEARLGQFAFELLATQIKHAQTLNAHSGKLLREADYDVVEARLTDGHLYHPAYKSRMGFTLRDNDAYSPEIASSVTPLLLAVRRDRCRWAVSNGLNLEESRGSVLLGKPGWQDFRDELARLALQPDDYLPLPVHPWQWDEVVLPGYHQALARGELLAIGPLADQYLPQQSIRTLGNLTDVNRLSLKLSMNLINTSTSRVLAPHTVQNAPVISDWLHGLAERTDWPLPMVRPVLLREVAGVSFTPLAPASGQYGALSCIWRESVHAYLRPGERAVPMTAVTHIDIDGRPFIDPWVRRHGPEQWLRRLVERAYLPVLHLLWEHGTALESHAQNMILLLEDGLPARVALKDFHDGVRFSKALLSGPAPILTAPPSEHLQINPNSFLETESADELRDFTFDALFFVSLAELSWLFLRNYDMEEKRFWQVTGEVLHAHQSRNPKGAARYSLFDCFADEVGIELLASRRFQPETRLRTRHAPNPLARIEEPLCI